MATSKSSTSGSASASGTATISNPSVSVSAPTGGTTSGAAGVGMGPTTVTKPPTGFQKTVQQMVSGVQKDIPPTSSLPMAGGQVTQAQILGILQPVLDAFTAIGDAEAVVKQQRLSLSAMLPQARQFLANLKDALIVQFGRGSPLLKDFGVKDGSVKKKATVATKSAALVKSSETRALRNTQGKVEKAKVKFTGQVSPASAVKSGTSGGSAGGTPAGSSGNGAA
ncbi:MAG TPA: hypothetical protein VMB50_22575 [Myxococcales bacterium]|nr:hypothetical protein [Myxococcales bacterium]